MTWLASDWIWLALGAAFIGFLLFGRRGCAMGHGGHADHARAAAVARPGSEQAGSAGSAGQADGRRHRHGCC